MTAALARNPVYAQAKANVLIQEATLQSSQKDLLPTFSVKYGYTRQPDANRLIVPEDYYSYAFSVEQPLYRGRALMTATELNELGLNASGMDLAKAVNDLVLAVHKAYFEVLKSQQLVNVASQAVSRLESHLHDAKAFYEVGLIPKNDLLTSEVRLAQGKQDLLAARNSLTVAKATLNILMENDVAAPLELADVLAYQEREVNWEDLLSQAKESRPEINKGKLVVAQADKNIIMARAPYLPSLSLAATYMKQGDTPAADYYPGGSREIRTAQANLQWRFFTWGQSQNKIAEAKSRVFQAEKALEQAADQVTMELRKAFLDLKQFEENIKVTEKAIEQAEENYRINEERYRAQLATSTEVLDAQTLLTQARTNYYNALYDYNISDTTLAWAVGTLGRSNSANQ
ncbi:MAG: hypothetical protein A2521_15840 [Deltaproteobacteria bacterium RIFOXYD12_FULL_57_12]|nr:MAG: hypothetical protein A2521_15840 [Deltaproteobacteria bacterium RIFOXYD12_FULL_57_12]